MTKKLEELFDLDEARSTDITEQENKTVVDTVTAKERMSVLSDKKYEVLLNQCKHY